MQVHIHSHAHHPVSYFTSEEGIQSFILGAVSNALEHNRSIMAARDIAAAPMCSKTQVLLCYPEERPARRQQQASAEEAEGGMQE